MGESNQTLSKLNQRYERSIRPEDVWFNIVLYEKTWLTLSLPSSCMKIVSRNGLTLHWFDDEGYSSYNPYVRRILFDWEKMFQLCIALIRSNWYFNSLKLLCLMIYRVKYVHLYCINWWTFVFNLQRILSKHILYLSEAWDHKFREGYCMNRIITVLFHNVN